MTWNASAWSFDANRVAERAEGSYDLGLTQNPWKTQQTQSSMGTSYQTWKNRNHIQSIWSDTDASQMNTQSNSQPYNDNRGYNDSQHCQSPGAQRSNRYQHIQANDIYSNRAQTRPPHNQTANNGANPNIRMQQSTATQYQNGNLCMTASSDNQMSRQQGRRFNPHASQWQQQGSNGRLMNVKTESESEAMPWTQRGNGRAKPLSNYTTKFQQDGAGGVGISYRDNRMNENCSRSDNNKRPAMTWATSRKSSRPATSNLNGPLSKAVERSMRMISCTAEGIHYWINSIGESNRLIFELFGMMSGLDYFESKIAFLIKGKAVSIQCIFYSMDQELPNFISGDSVRVVGRFDANAGQFQCLSVRLATADEKSYAMKFVQAYSKTLQRFDMSRNEY